MTVSYKLTAVSALLVVFSGILSGCIHKPSQDKALSSWSEYQSGLATYLDQEIGRKNNMRVAPSSLEYPIGTVVRKDSMSSLTSKCKYSATISPPISGPPIPNHTATKKIRFSLDPGSILSKGVKQIESFRLIYDQGAELTAKISDVTTQVLAEDETLSVIQDPTCLNQIQAKEVSVIRGYVSAKYGVTGGKGITTSANAKVLSSDLVDVSYEDKGNFEMTDKVPGNKFVILADGYADKQVILSGGFLQEAGGKGCSVREVVRFGPKSSRHSGEFRSAKDFSSCETLQSYMSGLCSKPSSAEKCKNQINYFEMEAAGFAPGDK